MSLGFDHPSGVSLSLRATYYDQAGEFIDTLSGAKTRGEDSFGLVDLGLRYRLPRRFIRQYSWARNNWRT